MKNEEKILIRITKQEAFMMRDEGYGEFVKQSHTKHPKYYLVEEPRDVYRYDPKKGKRVLVRLGALNKLKKYRSEFKQTN